MSLSEQKRIYSIDSLRLIAAFLVVCIHTSGYIGKEYITTLARVAVPLFFMISGYFLYTPDRLEMNRRINKSLKKMAKLYLMCLGLTCIYALVFCWIVDGDFHRIPFGPWMLYVWLTGFSQPMHEVTGFWGVVLWFLQALIYGLLLIKVFANSLFSIRPSIRVTIALLLILIWTSLHYNGLCKVYVPFLKLLSLVIPYLVLGCTSSELHLQITKISKWKLILCGGGIFLFLLIEIVSTGFLKKIQILDNYYTLPFIVIFIFTLAIKYPLLGGKWLATQGRMYAMWIYVCHGLIILVESLLGVTNMLGNPILVFGLSYLLALPLCFFNKHFRLI